MDVEKLIREMTLEEKAAFVCGADYWNTKSVERLGIPSISVSDGPHGLRRQADAQDNLDLNEAVQAVCFPSGAGLASSFNRTLLERLGRTLGNECRAEGVSVILGPAMNIKRTPLCGRNFEYLSEDPLLAGELATAYTKGVQSQQVGVSLKHFAANNQEKRRMTVSSVVDERALREIYLPAFEKAVKDAKPATVMCAYNKLNGVYASENYKLLTMILRNEWGFDGMTMSDWGAVCDRSDGVAAGLDLEMPGDNPKSAEDIIAACRSGEMTEEELDSSVRNILNLVKWVRDAEEWDKQRGITHTFDHIEDHKEARRIARESMVLLKNEGVLPLNKNQKIAFIGEFARKPRIQGGGSSHINCTRIVSPMAASTRHTNAAYARGYKLNSDDIFPELIDEAVRIAAASDVAVVFAGLPDRYETEGLDRTSLNIPKAQNRLIEEIAKVQKNLVVVLMNGSPVALPWINSANAVLEAYLGGEAAGEAIVDILFGVVNPSGKLAETFPLSLHDTPTINYFLKNELTEEYRESIFVGYRYYDRMKRPVLFPFGHGLSYTSFEYSDLKLEKSGDITADGRVRVSFKLTNTGSRRGAEAAQLYVAKRGSRIFRAPKELKGFEKVMLEPGETAFVSIPLDMRAFAYYSTVARRWIVEPGDYVILVGASSEDIRLRAEVNFAHEDYDPAEYDVKQFSTYFAGNPATVPAQEFERLYGRRLPAGKRMPDAPFDIHSTLEQARNTRWGGRLISILKSAMSGVNQLGSPDMLLAATLEMPLHSIAHMSGGLMSEKMTLALVDLLNNKNVWASLRILAAGGIDLAGGVIKGKLKDAALKTRQKADDKGIKLLTMKKD